LANLRTAVGAKRTPAATVPNSGRPRPSTTGLTLRNSRSISGSRALASALPLHSQMISPSSSRRTSSSGSSRITVTSAGAPVSDVLPQVGVRAGLGGA